MGNEHRRRENVSYYEDDVHCNHPFTNARVNRYGKRQTSRRERREGAIDVDAILAEQSDDLRDAGIDRWGGANWEGCGGDCCNGQTGPLR